MPPHPMPWSPDVLPGFERATLTGLHGVDGEVEATLVRRAGATPSSAAVLYVHGFVDYFFQTHLADFFERQGLRFFALDLRRHGRSLRPGQWPNYTPDIDEYLADLDAAVAALRDELGVGWLLVNGHSTGGLTAALHAHRGERRDGVDALLLNSPFLDMNLPRWQERWVEPLLAGAGRVWPALRLPGLSPLYGQSVHAAHRGEWDFDTRWKPIDGFPVRAGWFRAIHRAHAVIAAGLDVRVPCLVLHAARSAWPRRWSDAARTADIVLDVDDIRRLAPRLGPHVAVQGIDGGLHDLVLSAPAPRAAAFDAMAQWLATVRPAA